MSRFKQPERALAPLPSQQLGKATQGSTAPSASTAPTSTAVLAEKPPAISGPDPVRPGAVFTRPGPPAPAFPASRAPAAATRELPLSGSARIGMLALCGWILAPYIQDLTTHFGFKPYLNLVFMAILPVTFVFSRRMFEGLKSRVGKAWLAFLVCMCVSVPFSYWRSASLSITIDFAWRAWALFFLVVALAATYQQCRQIVIANIAVAVLVLILTFAFGDYNSIGRLGISTSYLLANANDLAMHLLIDMGFFYYLVLRGPNLLRILGGAGMTGCLFYLLKTGSRGGLLALLTFLVVMFVFSRFKIVWMMLAVPMLAVMLAVMPTNMLHRVTMIMADPDLSQAQSDDDVGAIESQQQRQELMKDAVHYAITRPLTGVGPGEFTDAVWTDQHREGKHPPALGTHNTYLEVASEIGLPAFFCYVGIMVACIVMNYRTFQRARRQPELADGANIAYCLLTICAGFAVNIFFHHMTYTPHLPLLSGLTVALSASIRARPVPARPAALDFAAPYAGRAASTI